MELNSMQTFFCMIFGALFEGFAFLEMKWDWSQDQFEGIGNVKGGGANQDDEKCGLFVPVKGKTWV